MLIHECQSRRIRGSEWSRLHGDAKATIGSTLNAHKLPKGLLLVRVYCLDMLTGLGGEIFGRPHTDSVISVQ